MAHVSVCILLPVLLLKLRTLLLLGSLMHSVSAKICLLQDIFFYQSLLLKMNLFRNLQNQQSKNKFIILIFSQAIISDLRKEKWSSDIYSCLPLFKENVIMVCKIMPCLYSFLDVFVVLSLEKCFDLFSHFVVIRKNSSSTCITHVNTCFQLAPFTFFASQILQYGFLTHGFSFVRLLTLFLFLCYYHIGKIGEQRNGEQNLTGNGYNLYLLTLIHNMQ